MSYMKKMCFEAAIVFASTATVLNACIPMLFWSCRNREDEEESESLINSHYTR